MTKNIPSYNTQRLILGDRLPLDVPLSIILDSSERCNFKCNYCFRSGQKDESWSYAAGNGLMTMEVFEIVVRQLSEFAHEIKSISLSCHGEPLCNPNIAYMAWYLNKFSVAERIEMHTNASLLTEEKAIEIAKSGFTKIIVSLQGLSAFAYERVCGAKVNWESFYNNLKLLFENRSSNLKIHIKISEAALEKENYDRDKEHFYSMFEGISDSIFIEKITPLWRNIKFDAKDTKNKFGQNFGEINYCPLVFYKMVVSPEGEIYPCTGLPPPMCLGNIRNTTLREAWHSDKRREFLIEHLRLTRHSQTPCKCCFVPVNSVVSQEDVIDPYTGIILKRMEGL